MIDMEDDRRKDEEGERRRTKTTPLPPKPRHDFF
jgi:hypothetical protein